MTELIAIQLTILILFVYMLHLDAAADRRHREVLQALARLREERFLDPFDVLWKHLEKFTREERAEMLRASRLAEL